MEERESERGDGERDVGGGMEERERGMEDRHRERRGQTGTENGNRVSKQKCATNMEKYRERQREMVREEWSLRQRGGGERRRESKWIGRDGGCRHDGVKEKEIRQR